MLKFFLFFFLVIHTSAYSFEANQQEGICGPDAESVKECTDPSLNTNSSSISCSGGEKAFRDSASVKKSTGFDPSKNLNEQRKLFSCPQSR